MLWNPPLGAEAGIKANVEDSARQVNVQPEFLDVRSPEDFDAALLRAAQHRAGALWVVAFPLTFAHQSLIGTLALKHRLPAVASFREFARLGGLMTYAPSWADLFHGAAIYIDKILKGARPADLPVEQPMKFEFVINLKTAKALGLTIPPSLLLRADQVIE